jgi:phosphatidate cytidylyltransferase
MNSVGAWSSSIYRETALIVLAFLFLSGILVYVFRRKNYYFVVSWASIKSWLVVAPILFIVLGAPDPWPLIFLTLTSIYGAKIFFQIMGMYHRSLFVLTCYAGIILLAWSIFNDRLDLYNLAPMIVIGAACLIPMIRNNYKRMIQYISLTSLAFVFLGWSFMHLGLILKLEKGVYQLMYLIILTEFCDNTTLAISRYVGGTKIFDGIDNKRTWRAFLISSMLTIAVAGAMRQLLPDRSEIYWYTSGIIAAMGGLIGDITMSVVRRDAGIKLVGAFIIGRGDILHRMDRLIFVSPIFYYVMYWLSHYSNGAA